MMRLKDNPPTPAYEWMQALLDHLGSEPKGARERQCPSHIDRSPSLSINPTAKGEVYLHCFSGCTRAEILAALRCSPLRLTIPPPVDPARYAAMTGLKVEFPPVELRHGHPATRGFRLEAIHDYQHAVLYRWRAKSGAKELIWETRTPRGDVPGLIGLSLDDLPLYRQTEVRQGIALGEPVLLVESESSVDALRGWYATTWAGSASTINVGRLREVLGGYPHTVVIPDADEAGRRCYARMQAAGLAPHVLWPDEGHDARDLYRQLGPAAFAAAVDNAMNSRATAATGRVA